MNGTPITILLVEDNPGDILLTQEYLSESKVLNDLHIATDGVEAWEYLMRCGTREEPKPDLILLDLNLPRMDGRELLGKVKATPELKRIPVIVLTTSSANEDVETTYDLHANAYIPKPIDLTRFGDIVNAIDNFWFSIVKLP